MSGIDKKQLFLWSLYDFANSISMITFFLYYSQWLVVDKGISDLWFNITLIGSSILFILTVPVVGSINDKLKVNMPGLRITTLFAYLFYFLTGVVSAYFPNHYIWSIIFFTVGTYFYLFSFTFYTPLLNEIASSERHGLASGWGIFGDWFGQIIGLIIMLPLANYGRAQTFIPSVIIAFLLSLPMLIFFKEKSKRAHVRILVKQEYKNVIKSFFELCALPGVGVFLLSYFFFNDAVSTASNNFPIYTSKLFGLGDNTTSYFLLIIVITSAIGSPVAGWLADRYGFRRGVLWSIAGWLVLFPLMASATNLFYYGAICALVGLWFGSTLTITRAYLIRLVPPDRHNQAFTYYTLMERFATFVGPLSWSLVVIFVPTTHALNYRLAAIAMSIFVLIGLLIARKLPEPMVNNG